MEKKSKNYWPHSIVAAIIFVAMACVVTVYIAINSPTDMDNSYMQPYQSVNENINDILKKQKKFDEKFSVSIDKDFFLVGKNSFDIKIVDKDNNSVDNAKIEILLTRPHTSKSDVVLKSKNENGKYQVKDFNIENLGRWQVQSKIMIDEYVGFYKTEINATK